MNKQTFRRLIDMFMLFAGKTGGILVGIIFLPLFNKLLGADQFGVVALILSLQALLLMLDFGMATLVGRDIAAHTSLSYNPTSTLRNSEIVMTFFYSFIFLFILIFWYFTDYISFSWYALIGVAILFWSIVLQNISLSALFGIKAFVVGSFLQVTGVLARAIITLLALKEISPTVDTFIFTQLVVSLIHFFITRFMCIKILALEIPTTRRFKFDVASCILLAKRGKPLILFSIAGAMVMQLDKSIVTYFMTAKDLVPYFLTFSFCMLPIAVLAGPVKQYFQPLILSKIFEHNNDDELAHLVRNYVSVLMIIVIVPTIILWFLCDWIIPFWLHNDPVSSQVIYLTKILLPGLALGALGYIPYVFIIAIEDYKFQAKFSAVMTFFTLILVLFFAIKQQLYMICFVYVLYHSLSTIGLGIRSFILADVRAPTVVAFMHSAKVFLFLGVFSCLFYYFMN